MNDDRVLRIWRNFDEAISDELDENQLHEYGLDNHDEKVSESVSGKDFKTFPRKKDTWDDQKGNSWVRSGRYTWDFKVPSREQHLARLKKLMGPDNEHTIEFDPDEDRTPSGLIMLQKSIGYLHILIYCTVERAYPNTEDNIGETISEDLGEKHYSLVCGRAVLIYEKHEVYTGTARPFPEEEASWDTRKRGHFGYDTSRETKFKKHTFGHKKGSFVERSVQSTSFKKGFRADVWGTTRKTNGSFGFRDNRKEN